MISQAIAIERSDPALRGLCRLGGTAALIAVIFFRRNLATELVTFRGFGIFDVPAVHPSSALEWFTLFQERPFVGLTLFNLFDLVNYALVGLLFLALTAVLSRTHPGAMAVAVAAALVGVGLYFASNQAFSMAALSGRYAGAATEPQRAALLAAGEALLAIDNPGSIFQGTGITLSLLLITLAGLVISVAMLQSQLFSKATAYVGILANTILLGYFFALALAPEPVLLAIPPVVSAPLRITWYAMSALRLFHLSG